MKEFHKICICCPAGCHLKISCSDDGSLTVEGNNCPRGKQYGETEVADPRRIVTAIVFSEGAERICIPVRSKVPVPMKQIPALLQKLYSMRIRLPVRRGDVILDDSDGTTILASGSFSKSSGTPGL